jgi:site-specific recombinase XerD
MPATAATYLTITGLHDQLDAAWADFVALNKEVFLWRYAQPMTRSQLLKIIARLGHTAGIADEVRCSPHTLRHTFATEDLKAHPGALYHLQTLLGHTTLEMTREYAKLAEVDVQLEGSSVVERLGLNRLV